MPTTYTHELFGKMVYQKLDEALQEIIMLNKMEFTVGLHGPDILFYTRPFHKNRINELGQRMHSEEAAGFFEKGRALYLRTKNEGVLSYLFGFVCHFMLDSTCHPYIGAYIERTGATHEEIETELDREMMVTTGKNPFFYHPSKVIRAERKCVENIAAVFEEEGISAKEIAHTLAALKFYTNLTVCPTELKRKLILSSAQASGIYRMVQGRVIRKNPLPVCAESTRELVNLFKLAIPETVTVMEDYCRSIENGEELNYRFYRNYN